MRSLVLQRARLPASQPASQPVTLSLCVAEIVPSPTCHRRQRHSASHRCHPSEQGSNQSASRQCILAAVILLCLLAIQPKQRPLLCELFWVLELGRPSISRPFTRLYVFVMYRNGFLNPPRIEVPLRLITAMMVALAGGVMCQVKVFTLL